MLNKDQAQAIFEKTYPNFPVQACTQYKDLYLFRVKFPMPGEENFDPFFSVNNETGEVLEFSVTTDATPSELATLTWQNL